MRSSVQTLLLILVLGLSSVSYAQEPPRSIEELRNRFGSLSSNEQQMAILEVLPDAVGKRADFDWLLSRLSVQSLTEKDIRPLVKSLLRLERKASITPGALLPGTRVPDFSPPWTLQFSIKKMICGERTEDFDRDYTLRRRNGETQVADGTEGILKEYIVWGRKNNADPTLLSSIEDELQTFKRDFPPKAAVLTIPPSAPPETPAPKVIDTPATQNPSPAPTMPPSQTPSPIVEHKSPMWPWVVGILALLTIVTVALKRRT